MEKFCFEPIGVIRTCFKSVKGVPIQPVFSDAEGRIELKEKFIEGLKDLEGFSHIMIIYPFHKSSKNLFLKVKPYLEEEEHGVFATRAPNRPNSIGLSIVELKGVDGSVLKVKGVDVVDKTPLLDLKPYVSFFDVRENVRNSWLQGNVDGRKDSEKFLSDKRFE